MGRIRRTSSGNEHVHTRGSTAYGASEGEEEKRGKHDGPPPNDLKTKRILLGHLLRDRQEGICSHTCASPPQRGTSAVEPNAYAEPAHMNCSPFKSRMMVGSAAPIPVYIWSILYPSVVSASTLCQPKRRKEERDDSQIRRRSRGRTVRGKI